MKRTRRFALVTIISSTCIVALAGLTACSMYRNSGRKNFESNSPSQIHLMSLSATKMTSTTDSTTCWQQPANEPLWFDTISEDDDDVSFSVRKTNSEEIEVCVKE